ncbi:MAG TPA: hypothetical protein VIX82_03190 [Solirubrobacteraceae bacterium]
MMRTKVYLVVSVLLLAGAIPTALAAHPSKTVAKKPVIRGEEVGYFGSALVAHRIWVFAYSSPGPSAGNHVVVCFRGKCETAHGHNASTPWYAAAFKTPGLHMGDPVTFTVLASTSAGRAKVKVTEGLLCMHNNGSTPQH